MDTFYIMLQECTYKDKDKLGHASDSYTLQLLINFMTLIQTPNGEQNQARVYPSVPLHNFF